MKHLTSPDLWELFDQLPTEIQRLARTNYELLKRDPRQPSLRLKKARGYRVARITGAYMLEGAEIFEHEDPKYFEHLKTVLRPPSSGRW